MFGKSLELLKKVAPAVTRVGFIFNPDMSAYYGQFLPAFETEARQYSIELGVAPVGTEAEINAAVAELAAASGGGLMVPPDAYTLVHRDVIVQSTAQYRIPAIYSYRQLIKEGGLMSYGPETSDIVAPLGWLVFAELPRAEAYAPLYATIERSGILLLAALGFAFVAGLVLARKMVGPIQALRAGFGAMSSEAMLREIGQYAVAVVGLSAAVNFGLVTVLADYDATLIKIVAVAAAAVPAALVSWFVSTRVLHIGGPD